MRAWVAALLSLGVVLSGCTIAQPPDRLAELEARLARAEERQRETPAQKKARLAEERQHGRPGPLTEATSRVDPTQVSVLAKQHEAWLDYRLRQVTARPFLIDRFAPGDVAGRYALAAMLPAPFSAAPRTLASVAPLLPARVYGGSAPMGVGSLPTGCTDNALTKADGTTGNIQCTDAIMSDAEALTGMVSADFSTFVSSSSMLLTASGGRIAFDDNNVYIREDGTDDLGVYVDNALFATFAVNTLTLNGTAPAWNLVDSDADDFSGTANGSLFSLYDNGSNRTVLTAGYQSASLRAISGTVTIGDTDDATSGTLVIFGDNINGGTVTLASIAFNGQFTSLAAAGVGGSVNGVEQDFATADTTATDTTPVSVTGISLAIDASDTYAVPCEGTAYTAGATSAPQIGLDLPASATVAASCTTASTSIAAEFTNFTADDGACAATVGGLTTPGGSFILNAEVTNSTNAGNVVLRVRSETTDDVTVQSGAWCVAKKVVDS